MDEKLNRVLIDILGQSDNPNAKWAYYECPFCRKQGKIKRKFAVNTQNLQWKCWVCQTKGFNLFSLIRKLGKWHLKDRVQSALNNSKTIKIKSQKKSPHLITLPKQYIPLFSDKDFILKNRVLRYLKQRGIGQYQIIKYQLGFCQSGKYENRIIVPSFDENGHLNYFTGRSIDKTNELRYLNPKVQRNNIIIFQDMINWNYPVIITQGIFDAMTVNFNAIPLMGKIIGDKLLQKLLFYDCDVYLSLDNDAQKDQYQIMKRLNKKGLNNLYYINLTNKDPNQMGRDEYWIHLTKNLKKFTQGNNLKIMKQQLSRITI